MIKFDDLQIDFQDEDYLYLTDLSDPDRPSLSMSASEVAQFVEYMTPRLQTKTKFVL